MDPASCPLCHTSSAAFFEAYHHCQRCDLRFLNPSQRLSWAEESERYNLHQNVATEPGYQKFVRPVVDAIQKNIPYGSIGLDFGCGADSAIRHLLSPNYSVALYDPKYFPDRSPLRSLYDFVTATEVLEHLHAPDKELTQLRKRLNPNGVLAVMTHMYGDWTDFASWYYRRDPTHVCFYSRRTLNFIRVKYGFSELNLLSDRAAYFRV